MNRYSTRTYCLGLISLLAVTEAPPAHGQTVELIRGPVQPTTLQERQPVEPNIVVRTQSNSLLVIAYTWASGTSGYPCERRVIVGGGQSYTVEEKMAAGQCHPEKVVATLGPSGGFLDKVTFYGAAKADGLPAPPAASVTSADAVQLVDQAVQRVDAAGQGYAAAASVAPVNGGRAGNVGVIAPVGGGQSARTFTVEATGIVPANQEWVRTGVLLSRGQRLRIQAGGQWSFTGSATLGPNGYPNRPYPGTLLPTANLGALIGRVGGAFFFVGQYFDGNSPADGELMLSINDKPGTFGDNSGAMRVKIITP